VFWKYEDTQQSTRTIRFPASSPFASPSLQTLSQEFLRHAPKQIDEGVANPLDYGFRQEAYQLHALQGVRERVRSIGPSLCTGSTFECLSFSPVPSQTKAMNDHLRKLVGPEADLWTTAQFEQLRRDIDTMAALLLDLYQSRKADRHAETCGSANFDVRPPDR